MMKRFISLLTALSMTLMLFTTMDVTSFTAYAADVDLAIISNSDISVSELTTATQAKITFNITKVVDDAYATLTAYVNSANWIQETYATTTQYNAGAGESWQANHEVTATGQRVVTFAFAPATWGYQVGIKTDNADGFDAELIKVEFLDASGNVVKAYDPTAPVINKDNFTYSTLNNTSMEIGDSFTIAYNAANTPPGAKYSFKYKVPNVSGSDDYYTPVLDNAVNGTDGQEATGLEVTSSTAGDITTYTFTAIAASAAEFELNIEVSASGTWSDTSYLWFGSATAYKVVAPAEPSYNLTPSNKEIEIGDYQIFTLEGYDGQEPPTWEIDETYVDVITTGVDVDNNQCKLIGKAATDPTTTLTVTLNGKIVGTAVITVVDGNTPPAPVIPEGTKVTLNDNPPYNWQSVNNVTIPGITNWTTTVAEAKEKLDSVTFTFNVNGALSNGTEFDISKLGFQGVIQTNDTEGLWKTYDATVSGSKVTITMTDIGAAFGDKTGAVNFAVAINTAYDNAEDPVDVYISEIKVDVKAPDEGGDDPNPPTPPVTGDKTFEGEATITCDNYWGQTTITLEQLIGDLDPAKTTVVFTGEFINKIGYNSVTQTPAADGSKWREIEAANGKITLDASDLVTDGFYFVIAAGKESGDATISWVATEKDGQVTPPAHTHTPAQAWTSNATGHWHACTCDEKFDFAEHTSDGGNITTQPTETTAGVKTYKCTVCDYVIKTETVPATGTGDNPGHTHTPATAWTSDATGHWHACAGCDEKLDFAEHTSDGGNITTQPTETTAGVKTYKCTVCDYVIKTEIVPATGTGDNPGHTHTPATAWTSDATGHWHACTCDEKLDFSAHTYANGICIVCGAAESGYVPPHTHVFGTEWKYSETRHWHECACGERTDETLHTPDGGTVTKQPTAYETGVRSYYCTVCGSFIFSETIPATGTAPDPVTPYFPPSGTVTPFGAVSNEPYLQNDSGKSGWEVISGDILSTPDGEAVRVKMNGTTELPQNIVSDIAGRDIDLVLDMGGYSWTINGMSVTKAKDVDMRVRKVNKIPESTIQEFFGDSKTVQIDLRHNGDFGFIAELTVNVGKRYSGKFANSYCFKSGNFEFGDSSEIVNGKARLRFTHASSWLIAIDTSPVLEDVSSGAAAHSAGTPKATPYQRFLQSPR